jgi:hypothetical protein
VGIALRIVLALVNREANDDHLPVIRIIADEGRLPTLADLPRAWEVFQPKLYYVAVAALWKGLAVSDETARIVIAQLASCGAGIVTVLVILRLLRALPLAPRARSLTLALVALNPGLIAINAQATNDSFVIALGALTVWFGYRYFALARGSDFWWMTASAAAAPLAKGNGVVLLLAILATFALGLLGRIAPTAPARPLREVAARAAISLALVVAAGALLGPYRELHAAYGSPFANPATANPDWPRFIAKTPVPRPGVRSVVEALGTFRLGDLLLHPMITNGERLLEASRTSLWSQLYGRATFSRFASHPPSWETKRAPVAWLGRCLLLLGLVPAMLLVVGLVRGAGALLGGLGARGRARPILLGDAFLVVVACGALAMVALYALQFRDYASMKEIFVYPALAAFAALLAGELDRLGVGRRETRLTRAVFASCALLAIGQAIDVVLLMAHLLARGLA